MSAPCMKCGALTDNQIEFAGLLSGTLFMCEPCLGPSMAEFRERQRQFRELVDAGVSRQAANAIMIARIESAAPS